MEMGRKVLEGLSPILCVYRDGFCVPGCQFQISMLLNQLASNKNKRAPTSPSLKIRIQIGCRVITGFCVWKEG